MRNFKDSIYSAMNTPFRQLALQAAAAILVLSLAWPYYGLRAEAMPWFTVACCIGGVALAMAWLSRQPHWWRVIHAVFMPLAWFVGQWSIDPGWFLLAFILLLLVYRGALAGQIPLYLSNAETVNALAGMLQRDSPGTLLDLGAGLGSLLCPLARRFPEMRFTGIENAPLTWLIGWLRTRRYPNIQWRWGSFWEVDLARFDMVYAFLSPAPMLALWEKARAEMRPGAYLISNSFIVPDVEPESAVETGGAANRVLYVYRT